MKKFKKKRGKYINQTKTIHSVQKTIISIGSASEYEWYFKCHRIYYNGSVTECTNLYIFSDTCL